MLKSIIINLRWKTPLFYKRGSKTSLISRTEIISEVEGSVIWNVARIAQVVKKEIHFGDDSVGDNLGAIVRKYLLTEIAGDKKRKINLYTVFVFKRVCHTV